MHIPPTSSSRYITPSLSVIQNCVKFVMIARTPIKNAKHQKRCASSPTMSSITPALPANIWRRANIDKGEVQPLPIELVVHGRPYPVQ